MFHRHAKDSTVSPVGTADIDKKDAVIVNEKHADVADNKPAATSDAPVEKAWMASDKDQDAIPENNMWLVAPSLMLVLFLAALDNTIVTTALPTISSQFDATPSEYSWTGTSYLLVSTIMVPCWGRVSDIVGRKEILLPGIIIFAIGSALCGAAKSMTWLIGARAMQGFGGGSILSLTQIIVGDIVPLQKRGAFNSFLGSIWGIASVLGPLFGGLICERTTWRWIFFINLPTCGIAIPCLYFSLKLNPTKKTTWSALARTFDFPGLALIMVGCALLVVGFAGASDNGWGNKQTIAMLVVGLVLFAASLVNFLLTKRNAIIPARVLRTPTISLWMICSTLHASSFLAASFYFPVFFQGVQGASPLMSGVYVLPFSLVVSIGTIISGQINTRYKIIRPMVWIGYAIATLGYGLCIKYLTWDSSVGSQVGVLIITGLGVGLSLAVPLLCVQAAMPLKEMAASTSAWLLTRSLGGTLGIAIFQAVISTGLDSRFPKLQGYGTDFTIPHDLAGYHQIHDLPAGPERDAALAAFSDSLRLLWIIWTPMVGLAFILSLFTKDYSLDRTPGQRKGSAAETITEEEVEAEKKVSADLERGEGGGETVQADLKPEGITGGSGVDSAIPPPGIEAKKS